MRLPVRLTPILTAIALSLTVLASGALISPVSAVSPSADKEKLWVQHCMGWERTTVPNKACVYGDKSSSTVIALVGDSHASHLFPALERIAKARHYKLVVMVKVSCAFIDMRVRNLALGREYRECATWNRNVVKRLAAIKPDLTLVVASRTAIHPIGAGSNTARGKAIGREVNKAFGRVAIIVDSPWRGQVRASSGAMGAIEKIAVKNSKASLINITSAICSKWPCPSRAAGITKYRDHDHFTATFSRTILGKPNGALDKAILGLLP